MTPLQIINKAQSLGVSLNLGEKNTIQFTGTRNSIDEILPLLEDSFDPDTTVVWDNVKFSDEKEIVIFMPYSKTTGFKGKFIDLYPIAGSSICPSASLFKLKKMAVSEGIWDKS